MHFLIPGKKNVGVFVLVINLWDESPYRSFPAQATPIPWGQSVGAELLGVTIRTCKKKTVTEMFSTNSKPVEVMYMDALCIMPQICFVTLNTQIFPLSWKDFSYFALIDTVHIGAHATCAVRTVLTMPWPSLFNKMQTQASVIPVHHICKSLIVAWFLKFYFRHHAQMENSLITWKQCGVWAQVSLVIQGRVHWIFQ